MGLRGELARQGNWLFKRTGDLPFLILPILLPRREPIAAGGEMGEKSKMEDWVPFLWTSSTYPIPTNHLKDLVRIHESFGVDQVLDPAH